MHSSSAESTPDLRTREHDAEAFRHLLSVLQNADRDRICSPWRQQLNVMLADIARQRGGSNERSTP
jgi:hypothetical protein